MTSGIEHLCAALEDVGIECVFGVPGTQTVALFEALRKSRLRTVLSSHELAAMFMASGYYRASGRIAAVATMPGPGFTYAVTGIAEARADSTAVLLLTAKATNDDGRKFQLQALDQQGIAASLLKGCFELTATSDAEHVIHRAYALAVSGEPGPVMVEMDMSALLTRTASRGITSEQTDCDEARGQLRALERLFATSRRPVLLLGQGAFASAAPLQVLAESLTIPVVTTPSARGIVPEDSSVALGFDALRGGVADVNALLDQSDLIVGLGCKLSHNGCAGFQLRLPTERFVHVDASAEVLGANYPARLEIHARVEDAIGFLATRSERTHWDLDHLSAVRAALRERVHVDEPLIHGGSKIPAREFFSQLRAALPRDAIVVTDSGQHQVLTRRHFDVYAARGLIVPSDFQSMGFGLPAAIGAKLANPDRPVIAVVGDGGFMMSGMELLTARREGIAITVIVFNDGQLGQIRAQQLADSGRVHAVELANPDYASLADSLGIRFERYGEHTQGNFVGSSDGRPLLAEVLVGDSVALQSIALRARAKTLVRRTLGHKLTDRLKALLGRGT